VSILGSRRERLGQLERATYSTSFESYVPNTGSSVRDAKVDGK